MSTLKYISINILVPFLCFLLFFILYIFWPDISKNIAVESIVVSFSYAIAIFIWLSIAWLMVRLSDILIWDIFFFKRLNTKIPGLIKQLSHFFIFFIAILGIVGVVFQQSVTGLLTASGVVGLIIGFAIKNLIADIFNGIALNLDKPFRIGDYIYIHDSSVNEVTKVLEITWRTTRLETLNKATMVISNRSLCTMPVTNYSKNKVSNDFIIITLDSSVPTERAINILTAATIAAEGVVDTEEAEVHVNISAINDLGISYFVKYWFDKNKSMPWLVKNEVLKSIASQLQQVEIKQSIPKTLVLHEEVSSFDYSQSPNPADLIRKVDIFASLTEEQWPVLLSAIRTNQLPAGETVVCQGDVGDSMFVLAEGLLRVYVANKKTKKKALESIPVGFIKVGQVFGEMSLLTGEPRSATVKTEVESLIITIPKEAMAKLFLMKPELIDDISKIITERNQKNKEAKAAFLSASEEKKEALNFSAVLINKIKSFFGFNKAM